MTTAPTSPPKSRHQKTCPCGVCGRDTAVNADGTFRIHGPQGLRCDGSGLDVRAALIPVRSGTGVIVYGTCGVCGITQDDLHEVDTPKHFTKTHNHNRGRVSREGDGYAVIWFRYRTFQWRRRYRRTHEAAIQFAADIKEHTW